MSHIASNPASSAGATLTISKAARPFSKTLEINIGATHESRLAVDAAPHFVTPVTEVAIEAKDAAKPSRKRNKKPRIEVQPIPLESLKWLTVAQASLRYPAFSEKAIRHLVAQAEAYQRYPKAGLKSNGFIHCICRPAGQRKIVIEAEKFEQWLQSFSVAAK